MSSLADADRKETARDDRDPEDGKMNDRLRDLVDIVILNVLVPLSPGLGSACEETFQIRKKHGWLPNVMVHHKWIKPIEQRASEMGLTTGTEGGTIAFVANCANDVVLASSPLMPTLERSNCATAIRAASLRESARASDSQARANRSSSSREQT